MRGTDRDQSTMFSYMSPEARIPKDHRLHATREMTNRALAQLDRKFRELYSHTGRPSVPPEQPLRDRGPWRYCSCALKDMFEDLDYSNRFAR